MHRGKGLGMYMAEGASSLAEAEEKEVSSNLSLLRIRTCSTMSSLVVAWLEDDPLWGLCMHGREEPGVGLWKGKQGWFAGPAS